MPWRPRLELYRGISICYKGRGLEIQTSHIQHEHDRFRELVRNAEVGPQDGPTNAGSSSILYGMLSIIEMPPKRTATTTTAPITNAAIKQLIAQGVADALVETKANRTSRNSDDNHDSGTGSKRIDLTQWFEKMDFVFYISNCTVVCHIKFASCTLLKSALTWWNSHIKTVGHDAAYGMPWKTLKMMMTAKYCPRGEIKKLEIELWNLKVKGTDVLSYNQRF
ncbi:reverse transcriptase domain-containing protein [Tanacetum coccineum]